MDALTACFARLEQQRRQGLNDWQIFEQLFAEQQPFLPDWAASVLIYQIYNVLEREANQRNKA